MATFTATKAGNWSDVTVWRGATATWAGTNNYALNDYVQPTVPNTYIYKVTTDNGSSGAGEPTWPTTVGGTVADGDLVWTCEAGIPQANDDVALAGYVIVWDTAQTRIPATGTLTAISSTGTAGQISIALDDAAFHGGASLNATTITAGTKPATAGIILTTGSTDHVLTITGNIVGGTDSSSAGIYHNSTGSLVVNGTVTAGTASYTFGIENNTTGSVTVSGLVTGGSSGTDPHGVINRTTGTVTLLAGCAAGATGQGLYNSSTGTLSITGSVTGGSGTLIHGITNNGAATVSLNGVITGGTGNAAIGFNNFSTGNVTLSATSQLVQGSGGAAYNGKSPAWTSPTTGGFKGYIGASFGQAANTLFPQQVSAGNLKSGVVSGAVTGTYSSGVIFSF
jgi:hypothetical protein